TSLPKVSPSGRSKYAASVRQPQLSPGGPRKTEQPVARAAPACSEAPSRRCHQRSACLRHILLVGPLALRPGALDIGERSLDLCVAEDGKARHVALIAAPDDGGRALLDDPEQDVIGMVPRVAVGIVWWRRE